MCDFCFTGMGFVGPLDPVHPDGHRPPRPRHERLPRPLGRRRRPRIRRGLRHRLARLHDRHPEHQVVGRPHLLLPVRLRPRLLSLAPKRRPLGVSTGPLGLGQVHGALRRQVRVRVDRLRVVHVREHAVLGRLSA